MIPGSPVEPEDPQGLITRLRRHAQPLAAIPTDRTAVLKALPGIRAVLFDVYGTLFISASGDIGSGDSQARSLALHRTLKALGISSDPGVARAAAAVLMEKIRDRHQRLKQRGREYPEIDIREQFLEVLNSLRAEGMISVEPTRELCEVLALEYECRVNPTWPMPGVAQTLQRLGEREIQLGIVSNAQFFTPLLFPAYLDKSLQTLGFDRDLCVWSYRLLEAKPSVRLFSTVLEVLSRRNIEAAEVLYVGNDRVNDILPAGEVGMKTALFAADVRSFRPRSDDPRIRGVREDVVLTGLLQVLEVLEPV